APSAHRLERRGGGRLVAGRRSPGHPAPGGGHRHPGVLGGGGRRHRHGHGGDDDRHGDAQRRLVKTLYDPSARYETVIVTLSIVTGVTGSWASAPLPPFVCTAPIACTTSIPFTTLP